MKVTRIPQKIWQLLTNFQHFPWRTTAQVLWARFREDRLGLTAGSLTFTTVTSLVPLATVALAIFSAFPKFAQMQEGLQSWMTQSLFPKAIANSVITYITQFASKANQLGWLSSIFLFFSALAVMLTVDGTLNKIWRVKKRRSLAQRILVYWAGLTLGPLALAASIALTSYALANSRGLVNVDSSFFTRFAHLVQFGLIAGMMTCMYRFVPNTPVRWGHAFSGGIFVAIGMELARRALSLYIGSGTILGIYGAFAALPILLLWLYILWAIVLLGAVIAAYLPSILSGVARKGEHASWPLQLSLEILQSLAQVQRTQSKGLTIIQLAHKLRASNLQLEPALEMLQGMDWVARLDEEQEALMGAPRFVLLIDPATTPIRALLNQTMLPQEPALEKLNERVDSLNLTLADAIHVAELKRSSK